MNHLYVPLQNGKNESRTVTPPNADEDMEKQELSLVAGGMYNGTATLEDSLAVSNKAEHTLII